MRGASGRRAERRAVWHYRVRGYRILGRNVWAGPNEIDIVARRGRRLVLCEVKSKAGAARGDPLEMVDAEKRRRLERAGERVLAARPDLTGLELRFEVVAVRGRRLERLKSPF
jgi:putative endonuclease